MTLTQIVHIKNIKIKKHCKKLILKSIQVYLYRKNKLKIIIKNKIRKMKCRKNMNKKSKNTKNQYIQVNLKKDKRINTIIIRFSNMKKINNHMKMNNNHMKMFLEGNQN